MLLLYVEQRTCHLQSKASSECSLSSIPIATILLISLMILGNDYQSQSTTDNCTAFVPLRVAKGTELTRLTLLLRTVDCWWVPTDKLWTTSLVRFCLYTRRGLVCDGTYGFCSSLSQIPILVHEANKPSNKSNCCHEFSFVDGFLFFLP